MLQATFTITPQDERDDYSRFIIEPLEKGYGNTLGVSLRRTLLTSIEGAAVTSVSINGVQHQYSGLNGMKEDVVEFILNLKQLNVSITDEEQEAVIKLSATGPGQVTAKDITLPPNVNISNTDLVLATLADKKSKLQAEITVSKGRGYLLTGEQEAESIGVIPVDASFSPIKRVAYKVEATRVGRRTDFDRLILDIWTNGSIDPREAVERAAKILVNHFKQVFDPVIVEVEPEKTLEDRIEDEVYKLTVEELDLPTRIANALRKGGYKTVKDLTQATPEDIAKVKNLGEKSVTTVSKALEKKGVTLNQVIE